MDIIYIERLGAVSLKNGMVIVECVSTGANGEERVSGELLIPASVFGAVASGLQNAGKQLSVEVEKAQNAQKQIN
ncbi:MAG TPA: hypothetical protein DCM31_04530 [Deferribacteraceae bacterium]|nr:hypothetical protein [Deferribacteraceae bacterium]